MTCQEYEVLLDQLLEGTLGEEEREAMRLHEQDCADCRARREALTALQRDLASLGDMPVPPMPAELHERWLNRVKEDAMQNTEQRKDKDKTRVWKMQPRTRRLLAWAAALVFVVGGTLLTRDSLPGRETGAASAVVAGSSVSAFKRAAANQMVSVEDDYEMPMMAVSASYDSGAAYELALAEEDVATEAEEAAAGAENGRASKIIRNVNLTLTTRSFDESLSGIKAACEAAGGRVTWENLSVNGSLRRVNLTLRIPAEKLDSFLGGAEGLGRVTSRTESASDVSDSYYDTLSRLETQRQLLERLRSLVTEAASLTELLQLESAIADTQYTMDQLQASLNSTDSKVAESTVELTLREEQETEVVVNQQASFGERLASALQAGVKGFTDFAQDMAVFLVAALPFLALVLLAVLALRLYRRRKRNGKDS